MIVLRPPEPVIVPEGKRSIFLAGSIEMGKADDWQSEMVAALDHLDLVALNPRRVDWDASWRQSIDEPKFVEQVEWELSGLETADVVVMWFAAGSVSPVTLLELGLTARSGRLVVGCPQGYFRRGNVEVVCRRYGVPLVSSFADLVRAAKARLGSA